MKVAYILDIFPVLSETFIVREILELRRKGVEIVAFARVKNKREISKDTVHAESKRLMQELTYFSTLKTEISKAELACYHLYVLLSRPAKYLRTFWFSARHDSNTFRYFAWSIYYGIRIERAGVKHIHAHFALEGCTHAMLVSMLTGIPYSFTMHAHDIFLPGRADLLEDKLYRAKFVVSISEYNKNHILAKYPEIEAEKIKIVHCGIDAQDLIPSAPQTRRKFSILAVGRLVEQKGFKYLLRACNILRRQGHQQFECNIIGEGKERTALEEMIRRYDLGDMVQLRGARDQKSVIEAMGNADLFVLPCVVEQSGTMDGIPVALMEAMAMGIPVVSTRVSGIPELVKGEAGILVEPDDMGALVDAINEVIRLSQGARSEIGKRGKAIVERDFNLAEEVDKLAALFKN